jgi:hypothetical protein
MLRESRILPGQRGSILLEAALLITFLCWIVSMCLDCILAKSAESDVNVLAQQCAVCSAVQGCDSRQLVANQAAGLSMVAANLSVVAVGGTSTVKYSIMPLTPFFPSFDLSSTATAAPNMQMVHRRVQNTP